MVIFHRYIKVNSVKPLYLNNINECIEKSNGNKYLLLVPTGVSKDILKNHEKLWNKIRDLIRSKSR